VASVLEEGKARTPDLGGRSSNLREQGKTIPLSLSPEASITDISLNP
jgi:hypothetical protein